MTFDLSAIALFVALSLFYVGLIPIRLRGWTLLVASLVALYWLQPPLLIRFSDFLLPTATVVIAVAGWTVTRTSPIADRQSSWPEDRRTIAVTVFVLLAMSAMRYLPVQVRLTASRPPAPGIVVLALIGVALILMSLLRLSANWSQRVRRRLLTAIFIVGLVTLFVIIKSPTLSTVLSEKWRALTGRDPALATPSDINWLGFSFIAFRLIHTLRDRMTGLLPDLSLREYLTFVIFFPALTAGPIDRAERFVPELRLESSRERGDAGRLPGARFAEGGGRIVAGLFKKFVLADTLARGLSLDATSAIEATSAGWLWLLLYGFAFRLYLDFAGYSDIAIGIGQLFGIKMPENFDRPYVKQNIAAFWQSWHITLSSWVRFYVFTPMSRWLLRRPGRPSTTLVVFSAQVTTMAVMGLWHGITANFLVWGVWHGLGLFVHKVWSDRTRRWYRSLELKPRSRFAWRLLGWLLTFHFVVLSWLWFALPDFEMSLQTMKRLFGF